MSSSSKVERILSLALNKDVKDALTAKIAAKESFVAMPIFEPNGHVSIADVMSFARNAKLVGELGGQFIVFISDVVASMHRFFKRDQAQFDLVTKYFITLAKALGCDGSHVKYVIANDSTPDDYEFFHRLVEFSIKLSINVLQTTVPCPKGSCLQCSDVLAPLMNATEVISKNADVVFAPGVLFP